MKHPLAATAIMVALAGCSADEAVDDNAAPNGQSVCTGGKCDDGSGRDLFAELDGRNEPAAAFLRSAANKDGTIEADYFDFLQGIGDEMGCGPDTQRTFTILLSNRDFFPRNMTTWCTSDVTTASSIFISTQSDTALGDINTRDFKLFAWDAGANKYNTYEFKDDGSGEGPLYVDVEPAHCATCHTAPVGMDDGEVPFTPIMNELTNPWTLWNAEPDFESHRFDDLIAPSVASAPIYSEMVTPAQLGSAADFEVLIRASIDRVVNARLRTRRDDADVDKALNLLRPMFCDETLNYASERHDSGEVTTAIVIDDALRHLFLSIRPDNWPYSWLNDGRMRLASLEQGEVPIAVMPVRGEATLQVEVGMVARRALTAEQVLAVRALDWKRPALSDFRCDLYTKGAARVRANPPSVEGRVSALLGPVLEELMHLEVVDPANGETVLWDLTPPAGGVYSIPDADDPVAQEAMLYGVLDDYEVDLDGFAAELEDWFDAIAEPGRRAELEAERQRRACIARAQFPSSPDIPGIDCSGL